MRVDFDGMAIVMRPLQECEIEGMLGYFNSRVVHYGTHGRYSQSLKAERDWFERVSSDHDCRHWAIVPDGSDVPVGITGLHDINGIDQSAISGIIIWDREWWGKGIASRAHLARTLVAVQDLNLSLIKSTARVTNLASCSALERVGYHKWGVEPCSTFRDGEWVQTAHLIWINPYRVKLLFPEGTPQHMKASLKRARKAIRVATRVVTYL